MNRYRASQQAALTILGQQIKEAYRNRNLHGRAARHELRDQIDSLRELRTLAAMDLPTEPPPQ